MAGIENCTIEFTNILGSKHIFFSKQKLIPKQFVVELAKHNRLETMAFLVRLEKHYVPMT